MTFNYEPNRIYLNNEDGNLVAEVTFPSIRSDVVEVNHTFVDESLRGQGVADKLLTALANKLEGEGKKAYCTCSYAKSWFPKHPEYAHIYITMRPISE